MVIEESDSPQHLMIRAKDTLSFLRVSLEMDKFEVNAIKCITRNLQNNSMKTISQRFISELVPTVFNPYRRTLYRNAGQLWSNAPSLVSDAALRIRPLLLPRSKPSVVFGFSASAFSRTQLMTMELLINGGTKQHCAFPDYQTRFPFLVREFKSQAEGGTLYMATNQAAGAGATMLNGYLELMRCIGDSPALGELIIFSLTMDNNTVRLNIHWMKTIADGNSYQYHMKKVPQGFLRNLSHLQTIKRAVKNILAHGETTYFNKLRDALDKYYLLQKLVGTRQPSRRTAKNPRAKSSLKDAVDQISVEGHGKRYADEDEPPSPPTVETRSKRNVTAEVGNMGKTEIYKKQQNDI
ncbi:hypothetical protein ABW19_dt0201207 [Dactylella cylindrospora]|nr:hypothetical protein ABW19_dt0201207 [Dactylella cylindrospora]